MYDMKLSFFTNDESFPFFIQYGGHDEGLSVHGHRDFCELVVVLEGKATHIVTSVSESNEGQGEERYDIRKGDVFCIGEGIRHGYEAVENFRICNIMFRPNVFLAEDYDVKTLAGFHALFVVEPKLNAVQPFRSQFRLSAADFSAFEKLISVTIEEYGSGRGGSKTLLQSLFMQIVVFLSRSYGAPSKTDYIESVANSAAYMERHFSEENCMERVLSQLHYSGRHFVRLFTSAYGSTPTKYLQEIRLRRACALLRETALPVTEISLRCGFSDPSYFSRAFRKNFGSAPNTYRQSNRL